MDAAVKVEMEALELLRPIDEATVPGGSEIQLFYRGATVFITGGTGFIGKQLIEKLFRACEIKKAFMLIRRKKGKTTQERLHDMLNDPVFGPVKRLKPDLESRLVCVEGDVADLRLGICDSDWNEIVEQVDIFFHIAASIRFDENIRDATLTNIRGTREALKLGRACKKLRSFVHVSTTYCNATSKHVGHDVKEQFYGSPLPPETMLALAETVDSGRLDTMTASLISDWPNTYTFTKAIAEELVRAEAGNFPVCIIRPSIVLNTYKEPVPGWLDSTCIYGPSGIVLGVGLGVLRVLYVDNKRYLSFVPVDYVNNATISAAWETSLSGNKDVKIYHVSTTNCKVTFRHVSEPMRSPRIRAIASTKALWYCYLIETKNRYIYWFLSWILHYIPAYVADGAMKVLKLKKPKGLKSFVQIYKKYDKLSSIFSFFLTNDWNFDDANLQSLWSRMTATDKEIFNFDMKTIDWDHNTAMWCFGIRKYVVKDDLSNTHKAVAKQKWLRLANYLVATIYLLVFWFILSWFHKIVMFILYKIR